MCKNALYRMLYNDLPDLLDAFLAVLPGCWVSVLLSCSALTTFEHPNTSGRASEAIPSVAESVQICATTRTVTVLPGLLDAFLAVLLGFRASALLSCSALITFGRPDTSGRASDATPNVAKSVLKYAVPRAVQFFAVLTGILDAFLAVLPAPEASVQPSFVALTI